MFVLITENTGEMIAYLYPDMLAAKAGKEAWESQNAADMERGDAATCVHDIAIPRGMHVALTMRDGNFSGGFDVHGPYAGSELQHIGDEPPFDNPHWVGVPIVPVAMSERLNYLPDAPDGEAAAGDFQPRALQILRKVAAVIDSTDEESEAFLDSGADSIALLLECKPDIDALLANAAVQS